jgi:hypothetical protein
LILARADPAWAWEEALTEESRILELLLCYQQGAITLLEFVQRVAGAVPDPLSE